MRNWMVECLFVMTSLMVLKIWIFPFFISLWFQSNDMIPVHEWTALILGVVTCMVYLGLGSSANYNHGLSFVTALSVFFVIHVAWLLVGNIISSAWYEAWQGLILTPFSLFFPQYSLPSLTAPLILLMLFMLGRGIEVKEKQTRPTRVRLKLPSN